MNLKRAPDVRSLNEVSVGFPLLPPIKPSPLSPYNKPVPVFAVDKPLGLTSHDVVARARKLLQTRRVGHAGTLDPLATGVLVLLSDGATKLSPFLSASEKSYLAWVSFGASTPTLDAEGPLERLQDALGLKQPDIERALAPFLTMTEQFPPSYSAIKVGGVKGYEAARQGEALELAARPAAYRSIRLLAFAEHDANLPQRFRQEAEGWNAHPEGRSFLLPNSLGDFPTALLELRVAAGTYLRAFARDLGETLGTGAFLSGLVRTQAGGLRLEDAVPLERLSEAVGLSSAAALPYPLASLSAEETERVRRGQRLSAAETPDGRFGLLDPAGELVAVAEVTDGRMKLLRVWA